MKNVLVTGGAGFLGSHLCTVLSRMGAHVICLDSFHTGRRENVSHLDGLEMVRHDIVEPFGRDGLHQIYHLACPASPVHYQRDPVRTLDTAILGTRNVLELARRTGARVLIASTGEVYGDPLAHPQPETYWGNVNPVGRRACYDEGKRAAEAFAMAYAERYGVDVRLARIFNTYGPRMREDDGRVVSNFLTQALRGQPLTVYGRGEQTRSLCYVSDLIDGLVRMMHRDRCAGPINLGNPEELTVRALAELVLDVTHSSSAIEHHPLPADDPARRRPDIGLAQRLLGWSPRVDVREGMRRTAAFFRERLAQPASRF